jgi:hypothetical protein
LRQVRRSLPFTGAENLQASAVDHHGAVTKDNAALRQRLRISWSRGQSCLQA